MNYDEFHKLWREPVRFEVEVVEVTSACRAAHKKGEKFVFSWNTPEGMCGEAFVGMYPVLFSLRIGGDMTLLGAEEKKCQRIHLSQQNGKICNKSCRAVPFVRK